MDTLQRIADEGGFIVFLLIFSIVAYAISPEYLYYFLLLILIGQVIFNYDTFKELLNKVKWGNIND